VVASTNTRTILNLQQIASKLENIEYEPAQFPGLIYHSTNPKGAMIFFNNGKLVCTGVNELEMVPKVFNHAITKLKELGIKIVTPTDVDIQSIVASVDLHKLINLNSIAITLENSRIEYNPKHFEGLVYRTGDPNVVTTLFDSCKIVCAGARSLEEAKGAINELLTAIESTGLMA
jgi:transcription initiation factor TFIID TATA-box-binding protein